MVVLLGLNNLEHLVVPAVVLPEDEPSSWLHNALIDVQHQVVALVSDIRVLYCIYQYKIYSNLV